MSLLQPLIDFFKGTEPPIFKQSFNNNVPQTIDIRDYAKEGVSFYLNNTEGTANVVLSVDAIGDNSCTIVPGMYFVWGFPFHTIIITAATAAYELLVIGR